MWDIATDCELNSEDVTDLNLVVEFNNNIAHLLSKFNYHLKLNLDISASKSEYIPALCSLPIIGW